jgi:flagellar motility protein MotE (MotC chaperone)
MTSFLPIRIRVLPVLSGAAGLLFALKVATIGLAISAPATSEAQAEEHPPQAPAAAAKPKEAKAAEPKIAEAKPPADGKPRAAPRETGVFSQQEADLLQALSERRAELDRRADEMQQREVLLKATEQRINEKIAQLQTMERSINATVKKREDEDDSKYKNLVKIYETMKPKEAARIFEQLDQPVLLGVVERMKEAKVAPIIASMDPTKAKVLTMALADRKPLPAPNSTPK